MGNRLLVVTLFSAMALVACGGASRGEAKGPEADPWAGYKGTYATAAGASGSPSTRMKVAKTEVAQSEAPKVAPEPVAADPTPDATPHAATPAPAKKSKAQPAKAPAKKKKK
jgi:hypothetical protein